MSAMYDNLLANVPTDLWIGGKWRKSSDGGRFDVIDPATENKVASVASATVDDAKAAIDAAQAAFPGWAAKKPRERGEILRKSYELIMRDAERLAKLGFGSSKPRMAPEEIEVLIEERQAAKKRRDFKRSDEIRKQLADSGIIVEDVKDGTVRWKYK